MTTMLKLTTICVMSCYNNKIQLLSDVNHKYKKLISALDSKVELLILSQTHNYRQKIKPNICEYTDFFVLNYYFSDFKQFLVTNYITVTLLVNNTKYYDFDLRKYLNKWYQTTTPRNTSIVASVEIEKSVSFDWFIYL